MPIVEIAGVEGVKGYKDFRAIQTKIIEVIELDGCPGTIEAISDLLDQTKLDGGMLAELLVAAFRMGKEIGGADPDGWM